MLAFTAVGVPEIMPVVLAQRSLRSSIGLQGTEEINKAIVAVAPLDARHSLSRSRGTHNDAVRQGRGRVQRR